MIPEENFSLSDTMRERGKQLAQSDPDYFKILGKKSAAVRDERFGSETAKKAYYADLGKRSAAARKAKREKQAKENAAKNNPLQKINSFLTKGNF